MDVRRATSDDFEAVAELWREFDHEVPPPTHEGRRISLLGAIVASIPETAENPEAAFKFITWALEPCRHATSAFSCSP